MLMKIKACLFDLDGVVVDTAHFHYLAWKNLAERLGFEFTEHDNERLKGVSRMDSLDILLKIGKVSLTEPEKILLAEEKNQLYLQFIRNMTPDDVLPGAKTFLLQLKDSGILLGIGSASKNARTILERIDLMTMFDVIVDGNLISRAKPHPEVFALGAKLLQVEPSQCIVFEDAIAGIQAAHNAGMKCIGVGSATVLNEADLVIPGFRDLKLSDISIL
jgi:beta-phosphoglucomutase